MYICTSINQVSLHFSRNPRVTLTSKTHAGVKSRAQRYGY
jgi:hypothetical protein